jgi:hypothetical protein
VALFAVVLLLLPYAGVVLLARAWGWHLREALLAAAVGWGVAVAVFTGILSTFGQLTTWAAALLWASSGLVVWGIVLLHRHRTLRFAGWREWLGRLPWPERLLLGASAGITALVGLIALVAPPNTWDSMTYRMSRVIHWIQNGSVDPYPTHILRQLHLAPWAEYAVLHMQLLSGSDALANFVQWFSLVGCAVAVSCIARLLGADLRGQVFAAVAVVTLPMAVLQGSSTQNDLVVSFWLACFVVFVLRALRRPDPECTRDDLLIGASLGLAILTKATAYLFATPFLLWWVVDRVRRSSWGSLPGLSRAGAVALILNLPFFLQNLVLWGNPVGPTQIGELKYDNDIFGPGVVVSNLLRNLALHLATPLEGVNRVLTDAVVAAHGFLGLDASDPRTTWVGTEFEVGLMMPSENVAGNPLHLLLTVLAIGAAVMAARARGQRHVAVYAGLLVAGFVLFCLYLRWQPWHPRLHLPLFVLGAAGLGYAASRYATPRQTRATAAVLLVAVLPWVVLNIHRPLIGLEVIGKPSILLEPRYAQYFNYYRELTEPISDAAGYVVASGCRSVGLVSGIDSGEYLLWVSLRRAAGEPVYLVHTKVDNLSGGLGRRRSVPAPCATVHLDSEWNEPGTTTMNERRTWSSNAHRITVYLDHPVMNGRVTSQVDPR